MGCSNSWCLMNNYWRFSTIQQRVASHILIHDCPLFVLLKPRSITHGTRKHCPTPSLHVKCLKKCCLSPFWQWSRKVCNSDQTVFATPTQTVWHATIFINSNCQISLQPDSIKGSAFKRWHLHLLNWIIWVIMVWLSHIQVGLTCFIKCWGLTWMNRN